MQIKNEIVVPFKFLKGEKVMQRKQYKSFSIEKDIVKILKRKIKSWIILKSLVWSLYFFAFDIFNDYTKF
jgi:hypothetical protein